MLLALPLCDVAEKAECGGCGRACCMLHGGGRTRRCTSARVGVEHTAEDEVEEVDIPLWGAFSPNDVKTDRDIFFIETSG